MATPTHLLRSALTADPARPFITFYDDGTGERTELSVRTFDNWVSKTANLLQDELSASLGSTLAVALPTHWQAAVWLQAGWQLGMQVLPVPEGAEIPDADVVVTWPERLEEAVAVEPGDVVCLSLRPALVAATSPAGPYPEGVLDGDAEVLAFGDRFDAYVPVPDDATALIADRRSWTAEELVTDAREHAQRLGARQGVRLLSTDALDSPDGIALGLLVPLALDGSVVLCRGAASDDGATAAADGLDARRATERVDLG